MGWEIRGGWRGAGGRESGVGGQRVKGKGRGERGRSRGR